MNANTDPLSANPLLDFSGLPRFADIVAERPQPSVV